MKKIMILSLIGLTSILAFSQEKKTLKEILNIAIENNSDIQMQKAALLQAHGQLMQTKGAFDVVAGASAEYQMQQNPVDKDDPSYNMAYSPYYTDASMSSNIAIYKENTQSQQIQSQLFLQKLFSFGLNSKLSYTMSRQESKGDYSYNSIFDRGVKNGIYKEIDDGKAMNQGTVALELSLPLFKSFNNSMQKNQLEQAKNFYEMMQMQLNSEISKVILETILAWENYVQKNKKLGLLKELNVRLESRRNDIERLLRAGVRPASDRLNFDVNAMETARNLVLAEIDVNMAKNNLLHIINTNTDFDIFINDSEFNTDFVTTTEIPVLSDGELDSIIQKHPEILVQQKKLTNAELALKNSRVDKMPDVNLNFGVGITGTKYSDSFGDYVSSGFQNVKGANISGGLGVSAKIGNRSKKGVEEQCLSQVNQQKTMLDSLRNQISIDVRTSEKKLELYRQNILNAENILEMQRKLYESEQKRFNAGLITTQDLIRSDDNYLQSEISYYQIILDYFYEFVNYKHLTMNLVDFSDSNDMAGNLDYFLN